MTTSQRPATLSGYPLGSVHPTRRTTRSGARASRLSRRAARAGSALLLAFGVTD
jgi:hypothetical protein